MTVACLIQARTGSTRFPAKVHAMLGGATVIEHVIHRARQIQGVDVTRVIWPEQYPHRDEQDVLGRYADAARLYRADVVMRVTGDCPLLDPRVSELVLQAFFAQGVLYASNVYPKRTFPDGLDTEVIAREALIHADAQVTNAHDREHVTPWIQRTFPVASVELPVDWSHIRLTVDTPEDLEWLKTALKAPRSFPLYRGKEEKP